MKRAKPPAFKSVVAMAARGVKLAGQTRPLDLKEATRQLLTHCQHKSDTNTQSQCYHHGGKWTVGFNDFVERFPLGPFVPV